jgi:hypothetical protein
VTVIGRADGARVSLLAVLALVLEPLPLLLLRLLVFLRLDSVALLHLPQAQGVGHESLERSLLLLFDRE